MPVTIHVSLSKKVGLPAYGSLGATCAVEFEASRALLEQDLDGFQRQVRDAYDACHEAIEAELARRQADEAAAKARPPAGRNGHGNGRFAGNGHGGGNGAGGNGAGGRRAESAPAVPRPATQPQLRTICAMAARLQLDLTELLRTQFQVERPEDLTLRDASTLIDELRATAAGPAGGPS